MLTPLMEASLAAHRAASVDKHRKKGSKSPEVAVARDGFSEGGVQWVCAKKCAAPNRTIGQLKVVCHDEKKSGKKIPISVHPESRYFSGRTEFS